MLVRRKTYGLVLRRESFPIGHGCKRYKVLLDGQGQHSLPSMRERASRILSAGTCSLIDEARLPEQLPAVARIQIVEGTGEDEILASLGGQPHSIGTIPH